MIALKDVRLLSVQCRDTSRLVAEVIQVLQDLGTCWDKVMAKIDEATHFELKQLTLESWLWIVPNESNSLLGLNAVLINLMAHEL